MYIARHGETAWNAQGRIQGVTDIPLNENGILQAEALPGALLRANAKVSRVYASVLSRARETAEIAARAFSVRAETRQGLEEIRFGAWEGHTWEDVQRAYPAQYAAFQTNRRYFRAPGGESYQDVLLRMVPVLCEIARAGDENVLVVTHGGCMLALLCALDHAPFEQMRARYAIGNAVPMAFREDALFRLQRELDAARGEGV